MGVKMTAHIGAVKLEHIKNCQTCKKRFSLIDQVHADTKRPLTGKQIVFYVKKWETEKRYP